MQLFYYKKFSQPFCEVKGQERPQGSISWQSLCILDNWAALSTHDDLVLPSSSGLKHVTSNCVWGSFESLCRSPVVTGANWIQVRWKVSWFPHKQEGEATFQQTSHVKISNSFVHLFYLIRKGCRRCLAGTMKTGTSCLPQEGEFVCFHRANALSL